jgi:cobalt-zinc-cadmium efflux system outer membrane protein
MLRRVRRPLNAVAHLAVPGASPRRRLIVLVPLIIAGCVSYEPAPVDPSGILADLRAISLNEPMTPDHEESSSDESGITPPPTFDPTDGLTIDEAAAVAVTFNPALRASRAEAGVAAAQLVEAGLLPDPTLQFDIGDSALDGILPLLRPGERDAKLGQAEARIEEVRFSILEDEWALKREVHLAFLDVLARAEQRQLNEQLLEVASHTHDFFLRARQQGAATALQETTAAIQSGEVQLAGERLAVQERRARQALNALLGLPPGAEFELQTSEDPFHRVDDDPEQAETLTERAVRERPDLKELLATYDRAEQRVRLEVARQWPAWGVGSILELSLPFFSRFNRPAIETAWKERARLGREVEAAIHALRAEVHDAVASLELTARQLDAYESEIEPRLVESLNLVEEAFKARQVTAGEILIAQSQVLDARERLLEARIAHTRAFAVVTWVTGDKTPGAAP